MRVDYVLKVNTDDDCFVVFNDKYYTHLSVYVHGYSDQGWEFTRQTLKKLVVKPKTDSEQGRYKARLMQEVIDYTLDNLTHLNKERFSYGGNQTITVTKVPEPYDCDVAVGESGELDDC